MLCGPVRRARSSSGPLPRLLIELAARSRTLPGIVERSMCRCDGADILRSGQRRRTCFVVQGAAPVGPGWPVEPVGPVGPEGPVGAVDPVEPPGAAGLDCAKIAVGGCNHAAPIATATAATAAKRACAPGRNLRSHTGTRAELSHVQVEPHPTGT